MTKIKICGLTRIEDIEYVNTYKPDFIGFVFAKKSHRYVSPEQAEFLKSRLSMEIRSVGVFVNESIEGICSLKDTIDLIQLHGAESEEYIQQLKKYTDKPIIKAFSVSTPSDLRRAEHSSADYILLDHGAGGTGQSFDWSLLKEMKRPYFLAGGLSAENVGHAIDTYHPFAVDTSSGVETDGKKEERKISDFITNVRKAK